MWEAGKAAVENILFKDTVELLEVQYTTNEIGETIPQQVTLGQYPCNIQNAESQLESAVSGQSNPQTIRVSVPKEIPLDYDKVYSLRIISARIKHTDELWQVSGWTEALLSTVITARRLAEV
jgi:hypothetical protein